MPSVARVHIVGAPRSGTTLMLELMVNGFRFDAWAPRETSLLTPAPRGSHTFCSKWPRAEFPRLMLWADPALWILSMIRDPRDVIVSRHQLKPDLFWANLRGWNRNYRDIKRLQGHPRFILVRYEELVRTPDAIQATIAKRMPFLEFRCAFSQYHQTARPSHQSLRAMHGLRPINAESVGAWRHFPHRVLAQIQLHGDITPALLELGYEADAGWLETLRGLEPDIQPGYLSDARRKRSLWWRLNQARRLLYAAGRAMAARFERAR